MVRQISKEVLEALVSKHFINVDDVTLSIDLFYPRIEGEVKKIEVGLTDVRAADSIRISYDFDRDGWKIEQASKFSWKVDDKICDSDWQEVAFVQAWAREEGNEDE